MLILFVVLCCYLLSFMMHIHNFLLTQLDTICVYTFWYLFVVTFQFFLGWYFLNWWAFCGVDNVQCFVVLIMFSVAKTGFWPVSDPSSLFYLSLQSKPDFWGAKKAIGWRNLIGENQNFKTTVENMTTLLKVLKDAQKLKVLQDIRLLKVSKDPES